MKGEACCTFNREVLIMSTYMSVGFEVGVEGVGPSCVSGSSAMYYDTYSET